TDWGRDTFISLPGLALATGNFALARDVLLAFAPHIRDGLIPNRFVDSGQREAATAEYNTVDAPLWFVLAACRYANASGERRFFADHLFPAVRQVIDGFLSGTRYSIGLEDDGLVHAGASGMQLTWMDAKIGDWVVTPRRGKPVEIQALWIASLEATARLCLE